MIFSQAMTEIELIVPSKEMVAVTRLLANQGVFHQVDASHLDSQSGLEPGNSLHDEAVAYSALERRIQASMQTLGMDEGQPEPSDKYSMLEIDTARQMVEQVEQEIRQVSQQLTEDRKNLEQDQDSLRQLEPIADIELDLGTLDNSHFVFSLFGVIPNANLERLHTSLSRIPYVLIPLRKERRNTIVWLAGGRSNSDILERAARSAYLNPLELPDIHTGTPAEIINSLNASIRSLQAKIEEDLAALTRLGNKDQQQLHTLLWRVRVDRMLADAMAHYGKLRYTYLIVGWVPSLKLHALTQKIKALSENILIESIPTRRPGDNRQDIPVALGNPGIFSPFESLVTSFARPRYHELDPTFLIALTFPILFGAMFGDVGQGALIMLIGAVIASRKVKALRSLAGLGGLIVACGLFAVIFGLVYGSLFGIETILPALWIRPMENITEMLVVAIGAGVVLLCAGFILNILNASISREWERLFFGQNGLDGFILYLSLIGILMSFVIKGFPIPRAVFFATAAISAVVVMFSELGAHLVARHRPLVEGGVVTFLVQSAFELFETLISFLSNTLSYVRVGAFAVAHVGLSAVIFILANLIGPGHGIGYWIVVAIGTLFIVGFEGLIIGIQTMRLEYYEFFSKFFKGGGLVYKPFNLPSAVKK
jgi:V/A-type H+/Na+-transporting ATPase subunit I